MYIHLYGVKDVFWLSEALYVQSFYFQYFSMFSFSKFSHSSFSRWTLNRSIFSLSIFSRSTLGILMFSRVAFSRLAFSCSRFRRWIISVYPSLPSILPRPSFPYISAHRLCKYTLFHKPLLSLLLSPSGCSPSPFFSNPFTSDPIWHSPLFKFVLAAPSLPIPSYCSFSTNPSNLALVSYSLCPVPFPCLHCPSPLSRVPLPLLYLPTPLACRPPALLILSTFPRPLY
jgi:hypothetical protein